MKFVSNYQYCMHIMIRENFLENICAWAPFSEVLGRLESWEKMAGWEAYIYLSQDFTRPQKQNS